jgi:hypothetical protein
MYLVVVCHCIKNDFQYALIRAQIHRHHHRHHHAYCLSLQLEQFHFLDLLHSSIVTASVSVAVTAVATKIAAPAVATQQTCGDFDALHQSIMHSTHTLDVQGLLATLTEHLHEAAEMLQQSYCVMSVSL